MKITHPPVTAIITVPGHGQRVPISGHPEAGDSYLQGTVPVGRVYLGDPIEGTAYGHRPMLDGLTLTELDELLIAFHLERDRVAAWDERGAVA